MSLHNLAQHVQSAGRDEDKVLVHMTPKEVGGLQALAMAHGGSLTINPETGLPEAGFLKAILPMVAGLALGPAGIGLTAMQAGLAAGAVGTLATGSLKQGLMAGLGAYGGAGLGAGLSSMGTAAVPNAVAPSAANEAAKVGLFANPTLPTAATKTAATGIASAAPAPTLAATNQSVLSSPMLAGRLPSVTPTVQAINPVPVQSVTAGMANVTPTTQLNTSAMTAGIKSPAEVAAETAAQRAAENMPQQSAWNKLSTGFDKATGNGVQGIKDLHAAANQAAPYYLPAAGIGIMGSMQPKAPKAPEDQSMIRPYEFSRTQNQEAYDMGAPMWSDNPGSSRERLYFNDQFTALTPYKAPGPEYKAEGGPVGEMSAMNEAFMLQNDPDTPRMASGGKASGGYEYSYDPTTMQFTEIAKPKPSTMSGMGMFPTPGMTYNPMLALAGPGMSNYRPVPARQEAPRAPEVSGGIMAPAVAPAAQAPQQFAPAIKIPAYQTPEQQLGLSGFYEQMNQQLGAMGGYADGGSISHLGGYSDGGRLLKGPGDGVSDSIPAVIGDRQPARLADGEFVVPARIVSELGNGSTDAGARKLYAMMDRVQRARKRTTGKDAVATDTKTDKMLPA